VIASNSGRLRTRLFRYLLLGTVVLWLIFTARFFTIADPIRDALRAILSFHAQVGALDLSVADVFAFAITLWAAVVLARLVSFLLELGLEKRGLARGVPTAISRTASYAIIALGTVLAFLASGMDVTKFAVVLGTLGVGIGFGLQNVVNNFVSGLILLYERPVQLGDIIEVGKVNGTVKRIGIRSSTVETDQGAEVVVPNADLISGQVTNWTLSHQQRRMDIDVTVPSDSAPERVRDLLVQVASKNPAVLAKPEPVALLTGITGGLQFQLRAWTDRSDTWTQVASDLRSDINQALDGGSVESPQTEVVVGAVNPSAGPKPGEDGKPVAR